MTSQPEPTLSQPGLSSFTGGGAVRPFRPFHQAKARALWLAAFTCTLFLTQVFSLPKSAYSGNIKRSPMLSPSTAQSLHGTG